MTDLLELDAATGQSQEQGVEAQYGLPPGYLESICNQLGMDESCKVTFAVNRPCKASGLRYYAGGGAGKNFGGVMNMVGEVENHFLHPYQRSDAQFCSDQCRNLWRDTKKRREQGVEL